MTNLIGSFLILFLGLQAAHADAFDLWSWLRPNTVAGIEARIAATEESCQRKAMDHLQTIHALEQGRKDYYLALARSDYRKTVKRCRQKIRSLELQLEQMKAKNSR